MLIDEGAKDGFYRAYGPTEEADIEKVREKREKENWKLVEEPELRAVQEKLDAFWQNLELTREKADTFKAPQGRDWDLVFSHGDIQENNIL